MKIEEHVPLSGLTTFKTGGPARFFITLDFKNEIPQALAFAREKGLPLIPLGGGSNILVPDRGVEAVCAVLRTGSIFMSEGDAYFSFVAEAGVSWDALVEHAVATNAWGLENLSAIPGTVGGAVVQNIGAYGAALSGTVHEVEAYDTQDGAFRTFRPEDCRFGYRTSIFKEERDRYFITEVSFRLSRKPNPSLSYRDLQKRFQDSASPSLQEIREAVIEIRKEKFPPLSEFGTAGSFFLNPIISKNDGTSLAKKYPEMPFFDLPEGGVKIPLAWLFDKVLSLKGMRENRAFVWEKQPLVIAAESGAQSKDVVALAEKIAVLVHEKTGIVITPEVRLFGAEKKNISRG